MAARRRAARGWRVYVLRCADGSLYTGATNDLPLRLARHAAGKGARYTRARLPVVLVHDEPASDRSAALRREAALKRLSRRQKLALVAAGRAPRVRRRSPPPAARPG
ncbi:MAG TPA: GIY-YIG nuclease family protein [Anaeromyxobacter sp.]|nr:GIY-YIG nuclease family protein [Anaeromyxobacter sp.]